MIGVYGLANLLQSVAAANTTAHETLDPALLVRLCRHRTYLFGLFCQVVGFVLAFLARRDLPLYLVQSTVAAGLGVTAVLGVLLLGWRLPGAERALLIGLCVGLAGLVIAAKPHPSRPVGHLGVVLLVVALLGISAVGVLAARLRGSPGSVALGALAGLTFAAAAVASRTLASAPSLRAFLTSPLLLIMIAHSLIGQLLLGLAMQRGSTTAAVAAMDAAAAVPAAIVGLLFLGDQIVPGLAWLATVGFVVTIGSVIGLTFYAEPQHHHQVARSSDPTPAEPAVPPRWWVPVAFRPDRPRSIRPARAVNGATRPARVVRVVPSRVDGRVALSKVDGRNGRPSRMDGRGGPSRLDGRGSDPRPAGRSAEA
jgi:hypothetical protein